MPLARAPWTARSRFRRLAARCTKAPRVRIEYIGTLATDAGMTAAPAHEVRGHEVRVGHAHVVPAQARRSPSALGLLSHAVMATTAADRLVEVLQDWGV